jgi:predicted phage baseplate assembly protein
VTVLLQPGPTLRLLDVVPYANRAAQITTGALSRTPAFTPEWRPRRLDPGRAFAVLFGEIAGELADAVRQLPEKARVELLRAAGIDALAATPARALVAFDIDPTAPDPIVLPDALQLGGRGDDSGGMVVFELERSIVAAPGKIAEAGFLRGKAFRNLTGQNDDPEISFEPFGARPQVGDALLLGIDGEGAPAGTLSLGIGVTRPPDAPRPQSEGALAGAAVPSGSTAQLAWEVLDGARWRATEPIRDETDTLRRTGIVELRVPQSFRPGRPAQAGPTGAARRWLRARLVAGRFATAPALDFVRINAGYASAGRTVRDEEPPRVPGSDRRRFRLSQPPVAADTLVLEVDDGRGVESWQRVDVFDERRGDEKVFVLDPATGDIVFGDGQRGQALPEGARVFARAYRSLPTGKTVVEAAGIKALLASAASVLGVNNPRRTAGGDPVEGLAATARRGPELIRARGRTVLPSDYELLALRAPGARVRRVHAMPGRHPSSPDAPAPGVVGLLIVPPEEAPRRLLPPLPDEETLRNVARYVSERLAPAGVEVVAAAPAYHPVRVEAQVRVARGADAGATFTAVLTEADRFLHPLEGGEDGDGWPFGETLEHEALLRRLLAVKGVAAIPRLSLVVDGRRVAPCSDRDIGRHDLLWPVAHLILPAEEAP